MIRYRSMPRIFNFFQQITLFILIDLPIHFDTRSMEFTILYLKGLPVKSYIIFMYVYFSPRIFFFQSKQCRP